MKIAPEAFRFVAVLVPVAVASYLYEPLRPLSVVFLVLAVFVLFFFRDPTRIPPEDPNLLVSPGDGKVVYVGPGERDPGRQQISIFLSLFDVHINRSPLSAKVERVRYTPGKFLAAYKDESGAMNEQNELQLADGDYKVTVRQIAGVAARRIVCRVREDDPLERGQRFGLIQFGSRMEVLLPEGTTVRVKVGDRVKGGETVIAERA